MSNLKSESSKNNLQQPHHSDGSELVPAEIQANKCHDEYSEDTLTEAKAVPGSTVDDEGLINNFAVEPEVYPSEYPSSRQQRRYIYWGITATLLVTSLVLITTFVS